MNQLKGKVVVITGASSGIGEEVAKKLAWSGATAIMIARSANKLESLQKEIRSTYNQEAYYYSVDLTDRKQWENTINRIMSTFPRVDALINNAGFGVFESFDEMDWDKAEKMLSLNVNSLMYTTYRLLPALKQQRSSHIINIASQAGRIATPKAAVYSATKSAVISFSNALRMELAQNTQVNVTCVNIGPVKTSFFDQADPSGKYQESVARYMLEPEKVATKICQALFTNKREINLPKWMQFGSVLYQLFPSAMERLLKSQFEKK
ncbi:SDR family oxidoreductase [Gracilibacillus oryzae]|uniref:SDR family oxidoreductase n=1 Tax=Gracilibacillus oryzae TaxID=1672701 RepID=A0A7C8GUP3_9BACI|nr:SDR family oxidoreductase [Gracilibacillus oryzae]KAB8138398.1 SDR family oxidoreductase [Gracilibacillus oryzae]